MEAELEWVPGGSVTSPRGWKAGAVDAGIKTYGKPPRLDLGLLAADRPCSVAGVFTQNRVVGAPVELCRERARGGAARAIVVNSGCANVAMGEVGRRNAREMAELAAGKLGIEADEVLVASTGVIGRPLPMSKIARGLQALEISSDGGAAFSRAIMTTDTVPKSRALQVRVGGSSYTIGGAAKGSGMVHPDMATVLCFLTTDAPADAGWLRGALKRAADVSFNMIDVDMDTSTSDTMLLFANGEAGGGALEAGHPGSGAFQRALEVLAIELARDLVRDGEGASTLIEVVVEGARSLEDARRAARTIASSPLVKTMVTGRDPNLGRIMMALGRSGAEVDVDRTSVWLGEHRAFSEGAPTEVDYGVISAAMDAESVTIRIALGLGSQGATAWGCDLTEGYVRINADYTT